MSQPGWVWTNGMDFPRMYSLESGAREELLDLFNYNDQLQFRALLDLEAPNFENMSLPSLCNTDLKVSEGLSKYCELVEVLPSLETTMKLMSLAKHPLNFEKKLKFK